VGPLHSDFLAKAKVSSNKLLTKIIQHLFNSLALNHTFNTIDYGVNVRDLEPASFLQQGGPLYRTALLATKSGHHDKVEGGLFGVLLYGRNNVLMNEKLAVIRSHGVFDVADNFFTLIVRPVVENEMRKISACTYIPILGQSITQVGF
jgi:hypothetical protein